MRARGITSICGAVLLCAGAIIVTVSAASGTGPAVEWQRLLGGTSGDHGNSIQPTADGGFIVAGESYSSAGGDVTGTNHGKSDVWVVKMDGNGTIAWQRLLGGSEDDVGECVRQTTDGGYILVGTSRSSQSGDVTGITHGWGFWDIYAGDIWVVKLGPTGAIEWQRLLGGSDGEQGFSVCETADRGFVLAGSSDSSLSGDVTGFSHGGGDTWVVKLNASGGIRWETLLGGNFAETAYSVIQTEDGGYALVGTSRSSRSGDVAGTNHGVPDLYYGYPPDLWVVKLNGAGAIQWEKLLGGGHEEYGRDLCETPDGGFILAGYSGSSKDGDVTGTNHGNISIPHSGFDAWVVRLDARGAVQWDRLIGGSDRDLAESVQPTADGGCVVLGLSDSSRSGDVTGTNQGLGDFWAARLGAGGAVRWQQLLGGSGFDSGRSLARTAGGGYVLVGSSGSSASGDVVGTSHGSDDVWLVKLAAEPPLVTVPGGSSSPTDTDSDDLYDDVNGNNRPDFADVVLYFNQMTWIAANEPVSAFDYNGNGRVDFADVVWLFTHL